MRTVIGIDPGLASTGWGVVRFDGSRFPHAGHGVITTDPDMPLSERLLKIHTEIRKVLTRHKPSEAGVEDLFFSKNVSSAMQVAQARGVVLMSPRTAGHPRGLLFPPAGEAGGDRQGQGGQGPGPAPRRRGPGPGRVPHPDHAADALAVAICHANRSPGYVQQPDR